ncbi:Cell division control protein 6-like protein [Thalictrum thalictroides]|uniref:Cell division control protein 6-like protein n=1 Tax=Thalictrum thalictroides TaxID=46969 RepID=A0A7J6W7B5_THATH|nr:Cell division control protein 6-like protein [Thalictrum thalictroides]
MDCKTAYQKEKELYDNFCTTEIPNIIVPENTSLAQPKCPATECFVKQETNIVRVDHMALALSRTFKSTIVDIIQSLPQHQQLNRSYIELCKSSHIIPAGFLETSNMCRVLSDQGILKIGQAKDYRSKRVTLKVDEADITFVLQGSRFFRNCL